MAAWFPGFSGEYAFVSLGFAWNIKEVQSTGGTDDETHLNSD